MLDSDCCRGCADLLQHSRPGTGATADQRIERMHKPFTPEEQTYLMVLLQRQQELHEAQAHLARLRLQQLRDPKPGGDEEIVDFAKMFVAPKRISMSKDAMPLLESAVDIEGLKSLLPMLVAGVLQYVDVDKLLYLSGMDADVVDDIVKAINKFIS